MTTARSPISILQELAAAKMISAPEYCLTSENNNGFKCEIKVGDLTTHASSNSKKFAKHLCASEALKILQLQYELDTSSEDPPNEKECIPNAVGKLNQLCLRKKVDKPDYTERWSNGYFIAVCKCLTYTTEGKSSTKKLAKRLAATEMLTKQEFATLTYPTVEAKLIEVFKDIDIGKCESDESFKPRSKKLVDTIKEDDPDLLTQKMLGTQLDNFGYVNTVTVLQEDPLIIALKASNLTNGDVRTFVKSCNTYKEGLIELLRQAIDVISVMNV